MPLPLPDDYLSLALRDGFQVEEMTLHHYRVGELIMPTGRLVACDPFVCPEAKPFERELPCGTFPVILSVAHIDADQRVAYAMIRFRTSVPASWEMLTVGDRDISTLPPGHIVGYPVDAGTGCFMDQSTSRLLEEHMDQDHNFFETMIAEMDKTYVHTWSWIDMRFGDGNLIAFSSGYGDGVYATYAGFDAEGEVTAVVTDFGVVPFESDESEPAPTVANPRKPWWRFW
jgi:hypothetical protein